MYLVTLDGIQGDVRVEIQRLEALTADMKMIAAGSAPDPTELSLAPMMDQYIVSYRNLPCLVGYAEGHPVLGCRPVVSSELWVFAPELGWARTHSRFYRLGNSAVRH